MFTNQPPFTRASWFVNSANGSPPTPRRQQPRPDDFGLERFLEVRDGAIIGSGEGSGPCSHMESCSEFFFHDESDSELRLISTSTCCGKSTVAHSHTLFFKPFLSSLSYTSLSVGRPAVACAFDRMALHGPGAAGAASIWTGHDATSGGAEGAGLQFPLFRS